MKTHELIALLATGGAEVPPHAVARRFATALGAGVVATALLMVLLLGIRPDIDSASRLPMFWMKLGMPIVVAAGSAVVASRLARPGLRAGWAAALIAAPVVAMWLVAIFALLDAPATERAALVMGRTWRSCLVNVPLLSLPVLIAAFWALKGLAPTRLALAGTAAGVLAGATGAAFYAFHCPEMEAPFIGVWYVSAMLIPAAAGALLGPRLFRW
jgi:hypothetical protein